MEELESKLSLQASSFPSATPPHLQTCFSTDFSTILNALFLAYVIVLPS